MPRLAPDLEGRIHSMVVGRVDTITYIEMKSKTTHYIWANLVCAECEEFQDTRRFPESGVVV